MKRFLLIAAATVALTATADAGGIRMTTCHFGRGAVECSSFVLQPAPNAKVIEVTPRSTESDADWQKRCDARLIVGKGFDADRWDIRNPDCF